MERELIFEILNDWNFWNNEIDTGKRRDEYIRQCFKFIDSDIVVAVTGARRTGKSYLMRQVAKEAVERGIKKEEILIVNLEDVRFTEMSVDLLTRIYELYVEKINPASRPYVFLDEIHNVPSWEKWVRTMHELGKAKIVISGSSSKLLSGELATVLTGRHLDVTVFPLSFKEFLNFKDIWVNGELDLVSKKIEIKRALNEYLETGGFPEAVLKQEKKQLLLQYFEDIVTKDVEKRHNTRKREKLLSLSRFYLSNVSNPISFNSLARKLGISKNTIEKFSSYLADAYLLFFVGRFSFSVREQEKSPRKVYSIDTGLSNAIGFRFSENRGRLMENVVALELNRLAALNPNMEFYYWKDYQQHEIDFVLKRNLEIEALMQVTYASGPDEVEKREIKALVKAGNALKCKNLMVVTWDYDGETTIREHKIKFVSLWKWLLSADKKIGTCCL